MSLNDSLKNKNIYSGLVTTVLSLQHVIILFVGIVLAPAMLTKIHGLSRGETHYIIFITTIGAGLSTLLQLWKFNRIGLGMPMFMGTSGAFMSCAHAAMSMGGFSLFSTLVLMATPFQIMFSYGIRFMRHILTPTVGGVIIMLAMTGLLKDSMKTWVSAGSISDGSGGLDILVGAVTILVMIFAEWFGRDRLRPWGLFLGICAGIIAKFAIDGIDFTRVQHAAWLGLPPLHWPELNFDISNLGHWATYFTFIVSMQVTSIKYVGDAMALQRVANPEHRKTNFDAIQGGLYSNSISMALTSIAGGMPSSSHSPNIPLMEITDVAKRRVAIIASIMLMTLIFSPKTAHIFASIPGEVMGAAGVVLVAHLFSTGMRMIAAELDYRNGVIAGLSLSIGLVAGNVNFFPDAFPEFIRPLTGNGFAVGGLVAVGLTILTRLSIKHFVLFHVKPNTEEITTIRRKTSSFATRAGMSLKQSNYLDLACEEIFIHALSEFEQENIKGTIRYKAYRLNKRICVEISFGSRIESELDDVCEISENIEHIGEKELNKLGLILLGRIVENITHQNMGEYTYICFDMGIE
ncbi:hypothetical protein D0S45_16370 [Marinifilum sp. JC120]|nr:hypothetical protein D0S45_16370 [Marinifilum sp. JC120]